MTEVFIGCCTITTWGRNENGEQVWRIRTDKDEIAEFVASRLTEAHPLHVMGHAALGQELDYA